MSNETRHYFGPYLLIKVKKIEVDTYFWGCIDEHHQYTGSFCKRCGKPIGRHIKKTIEIPISDFLDRWGDDLSIITPPQIATKGDTIIAVDYPLDVRSWLYLERCSELSELKLFPTSKEIEIMIAKMEATLEFTLVELKQTDYIISVTSQAGYVLDMEY